ncbi:MAG: 4Fe-4S binding protein [Magnetococcales bacterium]|nr:4Fe-4S binding protein [Magnetococcales bacterium]
MRALRRLYAAFFLGLFLLFLWLSDFKRLQGYAVDLFLQADPLTALAGWLTSGTLYQGMAWALVILLPTFFFGRFFCSWICPLGILNQFTGWLWSGLRPSEHYTLNAYRPSFRLKYYLLAILLILAAGGALQTGLLDPIALVTRSFIAGLFPAANAVGLPVYLQAPLFQGGVVLALLFIALIVANRILPRFWCRVICPLGALLGVAALVSPFRIRRNVAACTGCKKCLEFCQGGCDPHDRLRVSECHLCFNCLEQCPEGALRYGMVAEGDSVHRSLDLDKRRLLETVVAVAVFHPMANAALSSHAAAMPGVIRPPGSLPEADFLARCIKCAQCMRVCPTNVLQPALLEGGLNGLWTPVLINHRGYCEHHCVLCGQVCPTGAIRAISVAEKLGSPPHAKPVKLGTAFFDQGRCLPWAMHTPCIVCEEVCPTSPKAIWYKKVELPGRNGQPVALKQPYVDPGLCIGCGICENKCPVTDMAAIRVTSVGETRSSANQMLLKNGVPSR